MLTEEEKAKIQAEEIFRAEVRRSLEGKDTPPHSSSLWAVLNSSFALWFLSSVVLAGLTTAVATYQAKRSEHLRRAEIERRLDTEIGGRIGLALRVVRLQQTEIARGQGQPGSLYGIAESYLDNTNFGNGSWDFSIYPEYKGRTFRSLVSELVSLAAPSDRPDLNEAILNYDRLLDLGSNARPARNAAEQKAQAEAVLQLLGGMERARWRSAEGSPQASN